MHDSDEIYFTMPVEQLFELADRVCYFFGIRDVHGQLTEQDMH